MKRKEISHILQKKNIVKAAALVTAAALFATSVNVYDIKAEEQEKEETEKAEEEENLLTKVLDQATGSVSRDNTEVTKEETVYVISDASGNATETIVSDWLKNPAGSDSLTDATDLDDIENVKGDEGYQKGEGNEITWEADGSDIYYQGTSKKEAPIDVKVSYYLEDKEVSPQDIAGKSGKVKIRFDYTNKEKETVKVNDKEEEVYVPFAVVTGMILPVDHFTNVSVTNGKVISEGNNNIIVGLAFPGLEDSLDLTLDNTDAEIPQYVEVTADAEDFELAMTLSVAMSDILDTVDISGDFNLDELTGKMDDLTSATNQLLDGSGQLADGAKDLKDGTNALADGANTLNSKKSELTNGANRLATGINQYTNGVDQLAKGIKELKKGTGKLKKNVPDLLNGVSQLKEGSASAKNGADQLVAGYEGSGGTTGAVAGAAQLQAAFEGDNGAVKGAQAVAEGAAQVNAGVQQLASQVGGLGGSVIDQINAAEAEIKATANAGLQPFGVDIDNIDVAINGLKQNRDAVIASGTGLDQISAIDSQIEKLVAVKSQAGGAIQALESMKAQIGGMTGGDSAAQIQALLNGTAQLEQGAAALSGGVNQLYEGAKSLNNGVQQLYAGTKALDEGLGTLDNGLATLQSSGQTLSEGVKQLDDGAGELKDGVTQLTNNTPNLVNGGASLLTGSNQMADAIGQLADGANELNNGAGALKDGANELSDGMIRFNEEGIEKLTGALDNSGEVTDVFDRLKAVMDAGRSYQSFSGLADNAKGSVKFIIKTDAVKAE